MNFKQIMKIFFYLIFFSFISLASQEPNEKKLNLIYSGLDTTSIKQHLAFYELYPDSEKGRQALKDAWNIITNENNLKFAINQSLPFSTNFIHALISLVNKQDKKELPILSNEQLLEIEKIGFVLKHKQLKGHRCLDEQEVLKLPYSQIDLARGLFLTEMGTDYQRIRSYEALLDIMALQIMARLPKNASPTQIIYEINYLIFDEMEFRFPPHSTFKENIDKYTFLPSVLDTHQGVCLGVSIIYICLAQRLGLEMEAITPPGHIYVRYRDEHTIINVETTARGIHLDSEEYLSIDTHDLQIRNVKEVIGMAHFNQAAVYWQKKDYQGAYQAYLKAQPYLFHDPLLKEFMGYTLLFINRKEEGEKLLYEIKDSIPSFAMTNSTIANDYFQENIDAEGIKIIFLNSEKERSALLKQKDSIEAVLEKYPHFRAGLIQLAMIWVKLHHHEKALEIFKKYHRLNPSEPEVNYYLAILYFSRLNYTAAWYHLQKSEKFVNSKNYYPKILKELRAQLLIKCPECTQENYYENLYTYR